MPAIICVESDPHPEDHPHEVDENGNIVLQPMKDVPSEAK